MLGMNVNQTACKSLERRCCDRCVIHKGPGTGSLSNHPPENQMSVIPVGIHLPDKRAEDGIVGVGFELRLNYTFVPVLPDYRSIGLRTECKRDGPQKD